MLSVLGANVFHFTLQPLFINMIIIYDNLIFINQTKIINLPLFRFRQRWIWLLWIQQKMN